MNILRIEIEQEATFVLALVHATERVAYMMIHTLTMRNSLILVTDPILATILDHAPALLSRSCSPVEATPRCRVLHIPHQDMPVLSLLVSLPVFPRARTPLTAVGPWRCQFTERRIPPQPYQCQV